MAHLLKHSTSILKVGNSVFRVRDKFSYSVTNTTSVSNNNGIVYDPILTNNRLFVTNENSNTVSVLDAATFAVTHTITGISGAFLISIDPTGSYLLVAGSSGNLYKINASTLTVSTVITGLVHLVGVSIDPFNNRFFTSRYLEGIINVYDSTNFTLLNTLTGFNSPFGIAFDPISANNRIIVCNNGNSTLSILNATTLAVTSTISGVATATNLAFDNVAANNRFIVVNGGDKFSIYDATTYGLLSSYSLASAGFSIAFDPVLSNNRFLIGNRANGSPALSIINQIIT